MIDNMVSSEVFEIIVLTFFAGICIPIGGFLASVERIQPKWLENEFRHFLIAFGGGVLLGAITFVLVPEGIEKTHEKTFTIITLVLVGGISIFCLEYILGLKRRESPQVTGMILDYIPEAVALGGIVATGSNSAVLLAVLIGLQNLPEGFNAFRELKTNNQNSSGKILLVMILLVGIGPLAGLMGYVLLANSQFIIGEIMLVSSGGILYLIFQDIAPQSKLNNHWAPPLGAVFGFALALYGTLVVT